MDNKKKIAIVGAAFLMYSLSKKKDKIAIDNIVDSLEKHPTKIFTKRNTSQIDRIILHHYAGMGTPQAVAHYHVKPEIWVNKTPLEIDPNTGGYKQKNIGGRNWPGIAYHYVINQDGSINQTNYHDTISYHVSGENYRSIGVAMEGDFTSIPPTAAQIISLNLLIPHIRTQFSQPLEVYQHSDFANKPYDANMDLTPYKLASISAIYKEGNPNLTMCQDGTYTDSYAGGTCSHHGGFYNELDSISDSELEAYFYKEYLIGDYMRANKINISDFKRYGDRNLIREKLHWIQKDATPLDSAAQSLSWQIGVTVTPQDLIDIVMDYPSPKAYIDDMKYQLLEMQKRQQGMFGINAIQKDNKCPEFTQCSDGTYSTKKGRGTCSGHGGVLIYGKEKKKPTAKAAQKQPKAQPKQPFKKQPAKQNDFKNLERRTKIKYKGSWGGGPYFGFILEKLRQLQPGKVTYKVKQSNTWEGGKMGLKEPILVASYDIISIEKEGPVRLSYKPLEKIKVTKANSTERPAVEKKEKDKPFPKVAKEKTNFSITLDKAIKLANIINAKIEEGQKNNKNWHLHKHNYTFHVPSTRKSKYIKIDSGGSGKYMVDVSDGRIYGIKGYGSVNKGHRYGLIDDYMNGTKNFKSFEPEFSYYNPLQNTTKQLVKETDGSTFLNYTPKETLILSKKGYIEKDGLKYIQAKDLKEGMEIEVLSKEYKRPTKMIISKDGLLGIDDKRLVYLNYPNPVSYPPKYYKYFLEQIKIYPYDMDKPAVEIKQPAVKKFIIEHPEYIKEVEKKLQSAYIKDFKFEVLVNGDYTLLIPNAEFSSLTNTILRNPPLDKLIEFKTIGQKNINNTFYTVLWIIPKEQKDKPAVEIKQPAVKKKKFKIPAYNVTPTRETEERSLKWLQNHKYMSISTKGKIAIEDLYLMYQNIDSTMNKYFEYSKLPGSYRVRMRTIISIPSIYFEYTTNVVDKDKNVNYRHMGNAFVASISLTRLSSDILTSYFNLKLDSGSKIYPTGSRTGVKIRSFSQITSEKDPAVFFNKTIKKLIKHSEKYYDTYLENFKTPAQVEEMKAQEEKAIKETRLKYEQQKKEKEEKEQQLRDSVVYPQKLFGFNWDYNNLRHVWNGTTMTPEKRAKSFMHRTENELKDYYINLYLHTKNEPEKIEVLNTQFAIFSDRLKKIYQKLLNNLSSQMSSAIVGPAKFPVARQEKLRVREGDIYNELETFVNKALPKIRSKIQNPGLYTGEMTSRDLREINILKNIDNLYNKQVYYRGTERGYSFTNPKATLQDSLTRQAFNANLTFIEKAMETLKEKEKEIKEKGLKPIYTTKSKVWKLLELAQRKSKELGQTEEREGIVEIVSYPNIDTKIVNNFDADRTQIIFPGKPNNEIRKELKSNGFRWSPRHGAWQRKLSAESEKRARYIMSGIESINGINSNNFNIKQTAWSNKFIASSTLGLLFYMANKK